MPGGSSVHERLCLCFDRVDFLGDCPDFWEDRTGRGGAGARSFHQEQHHYRHPAGLVAGKRQAPCLAGVARAAGCLSDLRVSVLPLLGHLAYYYALKWGDLPGQPGNRRFPCGHCLLAFAAAGEKFTPKACRNTADCVGYYCA